MKAGVDWRDIEQRYRAGEAANAIAKTVDVTKQAILKRAHKEHWDLPATIQGKKWLTVTTQFHELADHYQFTPEKAASALEAYSDGANHRIAAASIGISHETWRIWRDKCPRLQEAIEAAQAHHARQALQSINKAAQSDWRAAERVLASNPLAREDWSQKGDTKGGLTINLNVPRASVTVSEDGRTAEIEAE